MDAAGAEGVRVQGSDLGIGRAPVTDMTCEVSRIVIVPFPMCRGYPAGGRGTGILVRAGALRARIRTDHEEVDR
ncbi:hypothetical protein WEB32_02665 [Streptomyces netropsis]|uniref:Uncharacterized protein n=1 Tax=Streptomyces netropsis TaxID=55404 RepID=A0A7W7PHD5_STRNE|nr:hypothetical protein [Streptomyces netropsis]MBB4889128.1 hypothetical protein [Streptomyces netropsis]GGR07804.1 hypothetical protein GCM10010219_09930 [Streptomyces netropsis]